MDLTRDELIQLIKSEFTLHLALSRVNQLH